jgi:hypothetical protein
MKHYLLLLIMIADLVQRFMTSKVRGPIQNVGHDYVFESNNNQD